MSRSLIPLLVVIAVTHLAGVASADDNEPFITEVRAGLLAHDVSGLWSGSHEESGMDINLEAFFRPIGPRVLDGVIRPAIGASFTNVGDTGPDYADLFWVKRLDNGLVFDIGLGVAWHDGEKNMPLDTSRKQLGTRLQFHVPIDVGFLIMDRHRLALSFQHLSNAGLGDENEGLDTLGLRYSILF